MAKIKVIAAVVDTLACTLYLEDGSTEVIMQGDVRLKRIMEEITPVLATGGIAEIELNEAPKSNYDEFEEQTGGIVKFFRIAKRKLKNILDMAVPDFMPPISIGRFPSNEYDQSVPEEKVNDDPSPTKAEEVKAQEEVAKQLNAVAQIMKHAKTEPKSEVVHNDKKSDSEDTLVAVVQQPDGSQSIVDGVEALRGQVVNAVAKDDSIGVVNFMQRIGKVADKRRHSAQDLMKFMARGDLPTADDGSIIIYKILKTKKQKVQDVEFDYVDCHSGGVPQKVGAYVNMDESMVDPDRRNECSNGLHVARRSYLGNFSGDVCVLAKVAPEDVIAVPEYDSNKMRVRGYHILFELSAEQFAQLKKDKDFNGHKEAKAMLGKAIAGDHVGKVVSVKITGQKGTGIVVKSLMNAAREMDELQSNIIQAEDKVAAAIDVDAETPMAADPIDPKSLAKVAANAKEVVKGSKAEQAQALFVTAKTAATYSEQKIAAQTLLLLKKQAKKSWGALGISDDASDILNQIVNDEPKVNQVKQAQEASVATGPLNPKAQIAKLLERNLDRLVARQILGIKQKAKKGWSALGVTDESVIKKIERLGKD